MPPKEINISNDGTVDIAVGKHRETKTWKNREITWSALLSKLLTTHRTSESFAEYKAMKKNQQAEKKDVGGFVGGHLTGGRRKPGSVLHRQLITVDADFADADFWENFTILYGCAAAYYSTHKHEPSAPRYRLVVPLDRPVTSAEYEPIARRIAERMGINQFDHTGFQSYRLMYWPSSSRDAVFEADHQDGSWLVADEVLATYKDWRDTSEWPISDREQEIVRTGINQQQDPLEKEGPIGAFCRTYSVTAAIETFLADRYDATDVDDRFTYREGSTFGGLVVYEDKFAYSYHATDPTCEKLCNAFDLVRLHLYGSRDEQAKEGTPHNRLPSYLAMLDKALKDKAVRVLLQRERQESLQTDFGADFLEDESESIEEQDDSWQGDLEVNRGGQNLSTEHNYELIMNNDPRLKGKFRWDDFMRRIVVTQNLPWRRLTSTTRTLNDWDLIEIVKLFGRSYGINVEKKIEAEIKSTAFRNRMNSLQEYLEKLKWDGTERVDTLLVDYQGARDCEYVRLVTGKALISAIARALNPGCKVDTTLTLVSKEGNFKSTLLRKLGGAWFSDSFSFSLLKHEKVAEERLQGFWVVEIPEMTGMNKAEVEHVKSFLSREVDNYRVIFEKNLTAFPRNCVFFGTTNNYDFLRGFSGNRRFWPVDVGEVKSAKNVTDDLTPEVIGQVWAEAIVRYQNGEKWWLTEEENILALEQQAAHTETDERTGVIEKYLDTLLPESWDDMDIWQRRAFVKGESDELTPKGTEQRDTVCVAEIWCEVLGGKPEQMSSFNTKDIHGIMQRMRGWERGKSKRNFGIYGKQNSYERAKKLEPLTGTAGKISGSSGYRKS
jgi:putative DNA primase/helicase